MACLLFLIKLLTNTYVSKSCFSNFYTLLEGQYRFKAMAMMYVLILLSLMHMEDYRITMKAISNVTIIIPAFNPDEKLLN